MWATVRLMIKLYAVAAVLALVAVLAPVLGIIWLSWRVHKRDAAYLEQQQALERQALEQQRLALERHAPAPVTIVSSPRHLAA